jgi:23S rRNA (cytidine2498-2'-O)-methyltransferase
MPSRFLFAVCQLGAEAALKQEAARRQPELRFAFSRPGFVTFRLGETGPSSADGPLELRNTFARTWGFSLGKVRGADDERLAQEAWRLLGEHLHQDGLAQFTHLHVWTRERKLPGDVDFDPAVPPPAAGARLLAARPVLGTSWAPALNAVAAPDDLVLDCVLVEPQEWWLGWHRAGSPETRWPGGVPELAAPADMISRAYLKLEEALRWSELPVAAGDRCVEIGSAPGGACQALLERGCIVTGIDPAEMDARVLAQPGFTHVRARAKDLKRSEFREVRWLLSDANVAPNYTLDTVEAIVTHPDVRIEGLVLTLKLTDPAFAAQLPVYHKRIRSWGYARVRARQLAFNRQEICVVATEQKKAVGASPRPPR